MGTVGIRREDRLSDDLSLNIEYCIRAE